MPLRVFQVEIRARSLRNAVPFYRAVFDWKVYPAAPDYALVDTGALPIVGIVEIPGAVSGAPSGALGVANYVLVDDCEREAARAVSLGGRITVPKSEVPNGGLFMAVADPWGTELWLWQPYMPATPKPQGSGANPIVLVEFSAPDIVAASAYYQALAGWPIERDNAGPEVAVIAGAPGVIDYVGVARLDDTAARVATAGGVVMAGQCPENRILFNDKENVGMGAIAPP